MNKTILAITTTLLLITIHAALATCDTWQPLGSCDDSTNIVTLHNWTTGLSNDANTKLYCNFNGTTDCTNASDAKISPSGLTGGRYVSGRAANDQAFSMNGSEKIEYHSRVLGDLNGSTSGGSIELVFSHNVDSPSLRDDFRYLFGYDCGAYEYFIRMNKDTTNYQGYPLVSITSTNFSDTVSEKDVYPQRTYFSANDYHYVVFNYNYASNYSELWLDGFKVDSSGWGLLNCYSNYFYIKPSFADYGNISVNVDELRVSDRMRTKDEIQGAWSKKVEFNDSNDDLSYLVDINRYGLHGIKFSSGDYDFSVSNGRIEFFDDVSIYVTDTSLISHLLNWNLNNGTLTQNFELIYNQTADHVTRYFNVTQRISVEGNALKYQTECSSPNCEELDLYESDPFSNYTFDYIRGGINFEAYDSVPYILNNTYFYSFVHDYNKSLSSTKTQTAPTFASDSLLTYNDRFHYHNNTRYEMQKLNETVYVVFSMNMSDVFINIPNSESPMRSSLANKTVLDFWRSTCDDNTLNDFIVCTNTQLGWFYAYGFTDIIFNLHAWAGGIHPVDWPPASYLGGLTNFSLLINNTKAKGWDFIPYVIYQDIYNSSYPYNTSEYIMKNASGEWMVGYTATGIITYASKYEKRPNISNTHYYNLTTLLNVSGFFVDTDGSNTYWTYVDRDANSSINSTAWNAAKYMDELHSKLQQGGRYTFTEDFTPLYTAGVIDGGELTITSGSCCSNLYTIPLIPDYLLGYAKNKGFYYGGYYRRFIEGANDNSTYDKMTDTDLNLYLVTSVGRGLAPMIDGVVPQQHNLSDNLTIKMYYLWKGLAQDYMNSNVSSIKYYNGSAWITLSQAALQGYDFNQSQINITWESGLQVYVNRHYSRSLNISVEGEWYNISPIGYFAQNQETGLLAYDNRMINSSVIRTYFIQTPDYAYSFISNNSAYNVVTFNVSNGNYLINKFNTATHSKNFVKSVSSTSYSQSTNGEGYLLLNTNSLITINFTKINMTITTWFGTNERDNILDFMNSSKQSILQYHKDVGDKYIRVWIYNKSIDKTFCSSGQLMPWNGSAYDFSCFDKVINATLNSNSIPWIIPQYCPDVQDTTSALNSVQRDRCAGYQANITKYYYDVCTNGSWENNGYPSCGDFSSWIWEIGPNEPHDSSWWVGNNYTILYNLTSLKIRDINPSISVTHADIVSLYWYNDFLSKISSDSNSSNDPNISNYHEYDIGNSVIDQMELLRNTSYPYFVVHSNYSSRLINYYNIGLVEAEYNLDETSPTTNAWIVTDVGKVWKASALRWLILSNASGQMHFSGSGSYNGVGFGMWTSGGTQSPFGMYWVTKYFNQYLNGSSTLYESHSSDNYVEVLAGHNPTSNVILLINKYNSTTNASTNLNVSSVQFVDANNSGRVFNSSLSGGFNVTLKPFEVLFLVNNYSISSVVSQPVSGQTYYGGSLELLHSPQSTNPVSSCLYSFDGGVNVSFDCSSAVIPLTSHGPHVLTTYVVDVLGGVGTSSVSFVTQLNENSGGGGGVVEEPVPVVTDDGVVPVVEGFDFEAFVNSPVDYLRDRTGGVTVESLVCSIGFFVKDGVCVLDRPEVAAQKAWWTWLNNITPRWPLIGIVGVAVFLVVLWRRKR